MKGMKCMKKIEIKKGISLWLIPENKFKTYYAGIFIHNKISEETATENALIPLLLKRGSTKYPTKKEISEKLELLMGASLSAYTSKRGENQMLAFSVSGVSDAFAPFGGVFSEALELLFDVALNPIRPVNPEYLASEKQHLYELIESEKNDKRTYASLRCREEMTKGEPYAVPENGYAEKIAEITEDSVMRRFDEMISSSPIDIILAGAFDENGAREAACRLTACLSDRGEERPSAAAAKNNGLITVEEKMRVSQGKLCVGYTLPSFGINDRLYPVMLVYNAVFGGTASSKLFMNVREKLSLAYYASSVYEREKGIIVVSSGIECKNFERARDEIFAQHEAMTCGAVTEAELDTAKKSLINSYRSALDSVKGLVSFNLGRIASGGSFSAEETALRIQEVTLDEVKRIASYVKPSTVYFLKGEEE